MARHGESSAGRAATRAQRAPPPYGASALVHAASLVAAFVVLVVVNRRAWFILDEWEIIDRATRPLSLHVLFAPHNEHWSTLPVLEYRVLLALFGLRTYWPYMVVLFVVHLLLAHLLWRLMRQIGVDVWVATALAGLFAVLGAGAENLTMAFQVSFVASVCAGMGAVLLVHDPARRSARRDAAAVALMLVGLLSSGVGVSMVLMVGLVVGFRRAWRSAAGLLVVPVGAYALWYVLIGHTGLSGDRLTLPMVLQLPRFMWTGLTAALTAAVGVPGSGGALAVGVVAYLILRARRVHTIEAPAIAGAVMSLAFLLVTGLGRVRLGINEASATRYGYVVIALLLPAAGILLTELLTRVRGVRFAGAVAVVALAVVIVTNIGLLQSQATSLAPLMRTGREQVLGAVALVRSGQRVAQQPVSLPDNPNVTTTTLQAFIRHGWFAAHVPVTAFGRIEARTALQTTVSTRPQTVGVHRARLGAAYDADVSVVAPGCVAVAPVSPGPEIVLRVPGPSSVRFVGIGGRTIALRLLDSAPGSPFATSKQLVLPRGRSSYLNIFTGGVLAFVEMPPLAARVCGFATGRA